MEVLDRNKRYSLEQAIAFLTNSPSHTTSIGAEHGDAEETYSNDQ